MISAIRWLGRAAFPLNASYDKEELVKGRVLLSHISHEGSCFTIANIHNFGLTSSDLGAVTRRLHVLADRALSDPTEVWAASGRWLGLSCPMEIFLATC